MSGNDLCPASAQPVQATIIKTLNKGMPGTCQPASQPASQPQKLPEKTRPQVSMKYSRYQRILETLEIIDS